MEHGIDNGILVGRLQKEEMIEYTDLNDQRSKHELNKKTLHMLFDLIHKSSSNKLIDYWSYYLIDRRYQHCIKLHHIFLSKMAYIFINRRGHLICITLSKNVSSTLI